MIWEQWIFQVAVKSSGKKKATVAGCNAVLDISGLLLKRSKANIKPGMQSLLTLHVMGGHSPIIIDSNKNIKIRNYYKEKELTEYFLWWECAQEKETMFLKCQLCAWFFIYIVYEEG